MDSIADRDSASEASSEGVKSRECMHERKMKGKHTRLVMILLGERGCLNTC